MRTARKLLRIVIDQLSTKHTKVKIIQTRRQQNVGKKKRKNFTFSLIVKNCAFVSRQK